MRTFAAGLAVELSVQFPRVPVPNSVTWRLLDNAGVEMSNGTIVTGPADIAGKVAIPAGLNEISTTFSKRTLVVTDGRFEVRLPYRLLPSIPFTVTPAELRTYLGVREVELGDDEIDIAKAFLEIQSTVGKVPFAAALSSGEDAELKANDAILYQAALNVIPSLINRIAQAETDGQLSFQRNAQKDFRQLAADTAAKLATALTVVTPVTTVTYSIFITTNDADPVTG